MLALGRGKILEGHVRFHLLSTDAKRLWASRASRAKESAELQL